MDFLLHVIAVTAMSAPNILGFNLIFGKGKIFHFGPLGVSVVAAYATFLVAIATGSFLTGLASGLLAVCVISALFAWLSLRLEPDGMGVMSIAMHLAILTVILNWSSVTRGALGIPRVPRFPFLDSTMDFALFSVLVAGVWNFLLWWLDRGPLGRKLTALSEHTWHAKSLGIDQRLVHLIVFLLGGIGALLTNILFHQYILLVHPSDFGFPAFIFFITVVVAGRPGSIMGCLVSLILLSALREGLRFVPLSASVLGPLRLILFGCILLGAVWWRRDTLFPKQRSI